LVAARQDNRKSQGFRRGSFHLIMPDGDVREAGMTAGEGKEIRDRRAQLEAIDRELARLRATHDLAMSAFKFDEANALQLRIAALEEARQALAAQLPAPPPGAEPPPGVVPVLARPRRWRRR
jgi:hypothetical protein